MSLRRLLVCQISLVRNREKSLIETFPGSKAGWQGRNGWGSCCVNDRRCGVGIRFDSNNGVLVAAMIVAYWRFEGRQVSLPCISVGANNKINQTEHKETKDKERLRLLFPVVVSEGLVVK